MRLPKELRPSSAGAERTPFIATFDDLLAAPAQRSGLDAMVAGIAAPEARMIAAALNLVGVHAASTGATLWVFGAHPIKLVIGWNCVGWEGLVIFGMTLVVGLRPQEHWEAHLHILIIGILGTVVVNLVRIALVSVLAAQMPATTLPPSCTIGRRRCSLSCGCSAFGHSRSAGS